LKVDADAVPPLPDLGICLTCDVQVVVNHGDDRQVRVNVLQQSLVEHDLLL
jgi:hypothetical protein